LLKIAREAWYHFDLLDGVIAVNEEQFDRVADKIRVAAGGDLSKATVAVWGLTFKARTDDLRDSPSLAIIKLLVDGGATVQAFDPTVTGPRPGLPTDITVADDAYAACAGADVLANGRRKGFHVPGPAKLLWTARPRPPSMQNGRHLPKNLALISEAPLNVKYSYSH